MNGFLLALSFMTRLPVRRLIFTSPTAVQQQRSIYYYPLVGAVLAAILSVLSYLSQSLSDDFLRSSILVSVWVILTGALHLDGLADSWDAYFAHHGDASRTLSVMKDPANGTLAVVAIVICIVFKIAAVSALLSSAIGIGSVLLGALVVPRAFVLLLMLITPYVGAQQGRGAGSALNIGQSNRVTLLVLFTTMAVMTVVMGFSLSLASALVAILLLLWWRRVWQKMIGGFTGDVLGAYIEMAECSVLLVACYMLAV